MNNMSWPLSVFLCFTILCLLIFIFAVFVYIKEIKREEQIMRDLPSFDKKIIFFPLENEKPEEVVLTENYKDKKIIN